VLKPVRDFLARPLVGSLMKVATGNIAGNGLNLIAMLLLSDSLEAGARGMFTSLQAVMLLIASLSDFGLNTTIIKFYRDLTLAGRAAAAEAIMRAAFWLRLAVAGLIALAGVALAEPLAVHWLDAPDAVGLFRLVCLGALGSSLWMYCQAAMQARQRFGWYAGLTTANHALRLLLFIILIALQRMTVPAAVVVLIAVPFVGSFGASLLWPREYWRARISRTELREQSAAMFHLSKWIFLSTIICSIIMRLDVILLEWLSTSRQVGLFGNANDIAQGFPLITAAVSTVLLPKLASTRRRAEMRRIVGYFLRFVPVLVVGGGMAMALGHWAIPFIRDGEYSASILVFDLLVVGFSISIIVNPLSFFCLAFNRASWLTWMNLAQLGISLAAGWLLIPPLGAMGAGLSVVLVRLFALGYLVLAYRVLLRMAEDEPTAPPAAG